MPAFRLLEGDVLEQLATLPDESVHCVVTSPPYWGLRDYGVDGQLGLEATPELYVERMVAVFREVRRVLRSDGTCWLNVGDSYNANGREGHGARVGHKQGTNRASANGSDSNRPTAPDLKPKDFVGIPWRLAFALQADGWWLRSEIIWAKPNPMPESVTDRPTKAHEQVFLLTKSARYFYDADAVREAFDPASLNTERKTSGQSKREALGEMARTTPVGRTCGVHANGRNLRSVWTIPSEPYPEAHFATYPTRLVEPCVKAGSSEHGCCPECGASWERDVERTPADVKAPGSNYGDGAGRNDGHRSMLVGASGKTLGWLPGCVHGRPPVPCTVLDPFTGSGTTAYVAIALGRSAIGIELNPEYAVLARKRVAAWGPKRMRLAQTTLDGVA
jgi:DNA modification methylase